jgi:hypothetical protein
MRTYLKNHFAPLCGLCGLNITAENAKKRKENPAMKPLTFIFETASNSTLAHKQGQIRESFLFPFAVLTVAPQLATFWATTYSGPENGLVLRDGSLRASGFER